jgi:ABC-type amino acid transport substrate-binding protein
MSKRVFKTSSFTPTAVADTTNFTNLGYIAIQGGSTTQRVRLSELFIGGLASSSAPTPFIVARDSTVGATLTALTTGESDAALDPAVAALAAPAQPFSQSTTKPQRSATLGLLNLSMNAFGGIVRWVSPADPNDGLWILGNTASFGEISLSCYTGGTPGLVGAHIIYDPQ